MNSYLVVKLLHLFGVSGVAAALALEWAAVARLRRASNPEQIREWTALIDLLPKIGAPAMISLLGSGLYLAATTWRGAPWLVCGLGSMLLLMALGAFSGVRLRGLLQRSEHAKLHSPLFPTTLRLRLAIFVGVTLIMVTKPELLASLIALGVALIIGALASIPAWRAAS
ncbi:MAG: hypothetical protein QM817_19270 [Archangium sp.]